MFTARYGLYVYTKFRLVFVFKWPCHGSGGQTPAFHRGGSSCPRSILVGFAVEKVEVGQVCLPVLLFPPFSIIPPMLYNHFHLISVFIRRTTG